MKEQQIIQGILNNDDRAFKALYIKTKYLIYNYIKSNSGTKEDAEQIISDTLLTLWQKIKKCGTIIIKEGKLINYTMAIARNLWLKELNKKNRIKKIDIDYIENLADMFSDNEDETFKEQRLIQVFKGLQQLGVKCQEIIRLYYFEEIKLKDIAKDYNCSYKNLKVTISRCRKNLIKIVLQGNKK